MAEPAGGGTTHDGGRPPAAEGWRPVLAVLANAEQRLLLAEVIVEEAARRQAQVPAKRRRKGLEQLVAAGLLVPDDELGWRVDATGLRALLSAPPADRPADTGDDVVDRFVRDGRIHTYPSRPAQRRAVLAWAARQVLAPAEVLDEADVNDRLARLTDETATLRRYLVDAGLLSRSPDGSAYRLSDGTQTVPAAAAAGDPDDGPAAAAAREAGLEVAVTRHGPVSSLAEAAAARGIAPRDLVKTLVVRRGEGDHVFVLVPGDRTFSWPKLRALLGTNRLSMPDAAEAREATGYERGTITPFGAARALPVYADTAMAGRRISIGGGAHGTGLTLDADEMLRVLFATVADLSDPPEA